MTEHDHSARRYEIEGRDLGYPTRFRDGASAAGLFVVRSRVANELIADSGFRVAEIAPGRALLVLTGVHYTDTDCGDYEETAQAFFVEPVGEGARIPYLCTWSDLARGRVATFTWKLQVTTTLSRDCGLRMWGYPKTLGDIVFERSRERARFDLHMEGRRVFTYSVRARGRHQPTTVTSPVYSLFEGAPHVGYLTQTYGDTDYQLGGGQVELGDHPLADELRRLGLPRRPLLATWNGHLDFSMSAPEKL
jgi:hypothetical protein